MADKKEIVKAGMKPSTGPYSAGIVSGGFLFVAGQGPVKDGKAVPGTIEEEAQLTLDHVDAVLVAAGCTRDDVVMSRVHLSDINDFDRFNKVYMAYFKNSPRPARTTVQSVLWRGIKVEIDVVAKLPE